MGVTWKGDAPYLWRSRKICEHSPQRLKRNWHGFTVICVTGACQVTKLIWARSETRAPNSRSAAIAPGPCKGYYKHLHSLMRMRIIEPLRPGGKLLNALPVEAYVRDMACGQSTLVYTVRP